MFPKDFVWGAATAAYQVEGAANEDGRGKSVWDAFCEVPGNIYEGHTGEAACDHYHKMKEDVALMRELGLKAYRFSLSWTRILPDGVGAVNQKGTDFYNALIDELLENGITPYITLFHWDYPVALYKMGGWMHPDSPKWFAQYAKVVAQSFGDRVRYFMTFNEPQCFIGHGFVIGKHAPGLKLPPADTVPMSHHVMLAHGLAVQEIRKYAKPGVQVGYAPTCTFGYPEDEQNPADVAAAREATFGITPGDNNWAWSATWWSDPVVLGHYPEDRLSLYGQYLPRHYENDLSDICQPLDFYGQNIYNGFAVKADENGNPVRLPRPEGFPRTACGWPITPRAIKWCAKHLYERYQLPIYITENGMSCHDAVSLDGKVHDPNRIDFLHRYLLALKEAVDEGAKVAGYFQWSLMDNFEWALGYSERFGLIYVDYPTKARIIKDSGYWYKSVIASNGANL